MSLGVQLLAPSHDTGATQATPEAVNVGTSVSRDAVAIGVGGGHGKQPVNNRSIDPDSYEKFLRGKSLFEARGNVSAAFQDQNLMEAATLLEGVVAKNPTYAPGVLGRNLFWPRRKQRHHGGYRRCTRRGQ
jgi:hypothetical protein